MERCCNHTIEIFGSSNRKYVVSVKDILPTCTCVSFAINHNRAKSMKPGVKYAVSWCKHIQGMYERLCSWQGEPLIEGMCDRCGGPTEVIDEDPSKNTG